MISITNITFLFSNTFQYCLLDLMQTLNFLTIGFIKTQELNIDSDIISKYSIKGYKLFVEAYHVTMNMMYYDQNFAKYLLIFLSSAMVYFI